jgi:trk system potassium uptake protein TrkA
MPVKRFVVVGLGNFGSAVAETLYSLGNEVIALDSNADRVDDIGRSVTRAAVADGTERAVLERVGAEEADAAVISTGDDITASALTALAMRDIGVSEIYVKVISLDHARLIEKIGVTDTIFPEREMGMFLAKRISSRTILNYVQLVGGFGVQEMAVPQSWVGRSLRELELPRVHAVQVLAVHDVLMDEFRTIPDPDAPLRESDTLLLGGTSDDLSHVAQVR